MGDIISGGHESHMTPAGLYCLRISVKTSLSKSSAEGAGSNFMAAQGGARSVLEIEEPWCLSEGDLETWYNENIQLGTDEFARKCQSAISRVVRFVHSNCSLDILEFDVDKVVKVSHKKNPLFSV